MGDSAKKILFVNSEMVPYLPDSPLATIGKDLPQGIQERKREIRTFMPRYGCINERKNQLHEVIRLSGINIIISDVDRPLVIKVASIASARIQVYFIDNEDYFRRKQLYRDDSGKFFADNSERAVFFARGVLETVKKLRWSPDIIHCSGWISHVLPFYLKKAYKEDPIFSNSKVVLSLYDDVPQEKFGPDFASTVCFGGMKPEDTGLGKDVDGTELAKFAAKYADGIIIASPNIPLVLKRYCSILTVPSLPYIDNLYRDGSYIDSYNSFYDKL